MERRCESTLEVTRLLKLHTHSFHLVPHFSFAGVIANVATLLHSVEITPDNFHYKDDVLRCYLADRRISSELQTKALNYLADRRDKFENLNETRILEDILPENLSEEIVSLCSKVLADEDCE